LNYYLNRKNDQEVMGIITYLIFAGDLF